jgi:hypothetical protein
MVSCARHNTILRPVDGTSSSPLSRLYRLARTADGCNGRGEMFLLTEVMIVVITVVAMVINGRGKSGDDDIR